MEAIIVYYKEIAMGELTFKDNNFVYKTYEDGIKKANELAYPIFLYQIDKDFVSSSIPESIQQWFPEVGDELYLDANITENNSDFEKLLKVAKLNLCEQDVYIKTKE